MGIAGEHLIAERETVKGHNERDADLLAVGAMIAGVAALGQRVGLRLALEIGAGHIIEQHFVLNRKQLCRSALTNALRVPICVPADQIECAIEPVFVDLLIAKLQQIAERRSPIPIFGDVEFA